MKRHDVIVIGSGIGGLTAALLCARRGRDVLVLEAAKQYGGFINPFARKHFWFDTGIHYIGDMAPGKPLQRQFERLGVLDEMSFREINPDGFDRYAFPDYEVRMCRGMDRYRDRLAADFPEELAAIDRFFSLLRTVDSAVRKAAKIRGLLSALQLLPQMPMLLRYRKATFTDVLDRCGIRDVRLRGALAGPGGDIGLPPSRASGLLMMAVIAHYLGGAYFPEGGTKKLRDVYVDLLQRHGATMKRNAPVDRILVEHGRVSGVRTHKGDEYYAPVVISNADAVMTYRDMLGEQFAPRSLRKKLDRTRQSLGSVCVFIGTDLQPQDHGLDDANIWRYPSYDIDALYQPILDGRLGDELPYFLTVPTLKDPSSAHAPEGKHTIELISLAPWEPFDRWKDQPALRRDDDYKELKDRLGRALVARAEEYLPGLSGHMEVFEVATPLTNTHFANVPRGAIYGPEHSPQQVGPGRFSPTGPVDGLFLCGSSVMGCGIGPCVSSGAMAGKLALRSHGKLAPRFAPAAIAGGSRFSSGADAPTGAGRVAQNP